MLSCQNMQAEGWDCATEIETLRHFQGAHLHLHESTVVSAVTCEIIFSEVQYIFTHQKKNCGAD